MIRTQRHTLWAVLLLVGLAALAYAPALRGGFVFDDDNLVTRNPLVQAPDGLVRIWFSSEPVDYWPMTLSSFWAEWHLWGGAPTGYHIDNLLLHGADALLLWLVLRRLKVPGAYWAALLFAVHPVNVQSVAWIAQRKNTLSLLFFLLSILGFLRTKWGGAERASASAYVLSLGAFLLAMLSKGSVAVLPLVLLGLVAWRRRLRAADFLAAIPYLVVAVVFTLVNIQFQNHGVTGPIRTAGVAERLLDAGAVIWFYLAKALVPTGLTFIYPLWQVAPSNPLWCLPLLAALALTAWLAVKGGILAREPPPDHRWRAAAFAWGYFCVALIPVMGLTDIYFMKYSLVADHYQYLAVIGVVALAAGLWFRGGEGGRRPVRTGVAAGVVLLLTVLTWRQAGMYRDAETLYRTTLERNPACWLAHNNLGIVEVDSGRSAAARADFQQALALNPDYAEAHFNLGLILRRDPGGLPAAADHFARAVQLSPRYADAHYYLANSLGDLGRTGEAITQYEQAIRWRPNFPDAELNLGSTLAQAGRVPEALPHFEAAVRLNPRSAQAQLNFAFALREVGRVQEGQAHYQEAVRLDPRLGR